MEPTERNTHRGHETRDANLRAAALLGVLVVGFVAVALVAMWFLFDFLIEREARRDVPPSPLADSRPPIAGPRLQISPHRDLDEMLAAEQQILDTYGWVERDVGIVRLPIERAMDLIAERGISARGDTTEEQ